MSVTLRSLPAALTAAALALVLTACGDGSGGGGGTAPAGDGAAPTTAAVPAVQKDDALAALVPQDIAADGKLTFGTDASYAPNEFTDTDGTTIIGMDIDLGRAIAQKLGLEATFENASFDGLIPGVTSKRYEISMSSFTINDERTQAVTMISYYSAGTSVAVKKGNPENISPDDLCGKNVGVQKGTVQIDDIAARNQACAAAGKPAINSTELQAQTDVTLALAAGRVSAMLADSPVAAYAVKTTNGQLEVLGQPYDTAPYGIVIAKNQPDYAKAIQGAVTALMADGTYQAILDKWGVADGAVTSSEISG
ncbi:polar amino acid transport system substrate-binding protein [Pseudonocardia thermophila]|uniref:Polar amino acid transport system substrate-binding protein n=1 Tax=Pseudonocardia thermophila TaxID=1848 RepID=A0A1M7AR14_PSETH|nr:ABC transporter substrate-binding protein [Pseudonocardia thermophila]SHL45056.1 polar amino acid transport system substrate-binding protein [Pseudonocardia thermophila]